MRGVGDETLLRGQHRAQAIEQRVHRFDQRPYFQRHASHWQRRQIAMRALLDFMAQHLQRRERAHHRKPDHDKRQHRHQRLRQREADRQLADQVGACALGFDGVNRDLSAYIIGFDRQLDGGDTHRLIAVDIVVVDRLPADGRYGGFDIRLAGDVLAIRPGHHVIELASFARAQHLDRDFRQIHVYASAQHTHLATDVKCGFQQGAIIGHVHIALGDVVIDVGADHPQDAHGYGHPRQYQPA